VSRATQYSGAGGFRAGLKIFPQGTRGPNANWKSTRLFFSDLRRTALRDAQLFWQSGCTVLPPKVGKLPVSSTFVALEATDKS
jgi:hypothetical protein